MPKRCVIKQGNSAIETHDINASLNAPPIIHKRMAYMITKQPASGCFHEEAAGIATSDVHVIDLQSAEESINNTFNNEDRDEAESVPSGISQNSLLPAVYLSLSPDTDRGFYDSDVMHRNLTLILISRQKENWFLDLQNVRDVVYYFVYKFVASGILNM